MLTFLPLTNQVGAHELKPSSLIQGLKGMMLKIHIIHALKISFVFIIMIFQHFILI